METVENPINVMKRYELKYVLTPEQEAFLRKGLDGHMEIDRFGLTTIGSLYYDTPDFRLVNASIEQPLFKEKMRLRAYGPATEASPVYLELKRKAFGIVYKRRVQSTIPDAEAFFEGGDSVGEEGQIGRELTCFRDRYSTLRPACLILYDRTAYFEPGGDLRLTIDRAPRYRMDGLDLCAPAEGELLLPQGWSVLEIKVQEAMPLWLSKLLDDGKIYKTSFSKYGEAYKARLRKRAMRGVYHV